MLRWIVLLLIPLSLFAYSSLKPPPYNIYAKKITYNWKKGEIIAQGSAEIVGRGYRIMGEYLIYNFRTQEFRSKGRVVVETSDMNLEGENLWLNLRRNVGYLENGRYFSRKGGYFGRGKRVVKLSNGDIWIEDGSFTTCDPLKPTWMIRGKEVVIKKKGYLLAKGLKVYVKNRKVLSLPYGILPVKAERKSGFLTPSFGSSTKAGVFYEQGFFYAPRSYMDFTFTAGYEGRRGGKGGVEFRFDRGDEGRGIIKSLFSSKDERWGVYSLSHYYWRRRKLHLFGNFFLVSDNDFPADFPLAPEVTTEKFIENIGSARTRYRGLLLQGSLVGFDRLEGTNRRVFKYLPELQATRFLKYRGFDLEGHVSFTRFSRDEGYDGWRLRGYGFVDRKVKGIELKLGGFVSHRHVSDEDRTKGSFVGVAKYSRDLFWRFGEERPILVVFTPTVMLSYFSPFSKVLPFDRMDNLPEGLYTTYGFSGRLSLLGREILALKIYQTARLDDETKEGNYEVSMDFLSEEGLRTFERLTGRRLSEVLAELSFTLFNWMDLNFSGSIDPYEGLFRRAEVLFSGAYKNISLSLTYSYLRNVSEEIGFSTALSYGPFSLSGFYSYLISAHKGDVKGLNISYSPGCYVASLSILSTTRPNETKFGFSLGVKGFGGRLYQLPLP